MYPDVLPSSDIYADGIVAISCVHPSVQLYMSLGLGIVAKSLWRNAAAIEAYGYSCPSVHLFTTFSGFSAFSDKSLERNIIRFGMLIYPADITADGYCHFITLSRHWRQRVLTSVIESVRLSVPNDITTLTPKDFSYQHKIRWDVAQCLGADCYLKWPCSANFCVFQGI